MPVKTRHRSQSETELYILGMDLFTILSFFWLAMLLVNPSVIPVSTQHNEHGSGMPGEVLTLYLSEDGTSVRLASPQGRVISLTEAGPTVIGLIKEQKPRQVVLAAPAALPTGQTNYALDQLMGWIQQSDIQPDAIRLLVIRGRIQP